MLMIGGLPRNRPTDERGAIHYLIIILIVVAIGAVGFFVFKKNEDKSLTSTTGSPNTSEQSPASTAQTDISAEWPIYENTHAGYSVKYPQGWFVKGASSAASAVLISNSDLNINDPKRFKVDIVVLDNPKSLSPQQFAAAQIEQSKTNFPERTTKVDSEQSLTVSGSSAFRSNTTSDSYSAWSVYVSKGTKIYLLSAGAKEGFSTYFDGIVQSFKFTQ